MAFLPKPRPTPPSWPIRKLLGQADKRKAHESRDVKPAPQAAPQISPIRPPVSRFDSPAEILRGPDQYQAKPTSPKTAAKPPQSPAPPAPPASATPLNDLDNGLKNSISQSSGLTEFIIAKQQKARQEETTLGAEIAPNSPVAELIEKIVDNAIEQGASDIHFEPQASSVTVKMRVDGTLVKLVELPASIGENLVTRIKVLSNLDITEKRLPQDGQFSGQSLKGRSVKFRVSTLPAIHGEKAVLRLLPSDNLQLKLSPWASQKRGRHPGRA